MSRTPDKPGQETVLVVEDEVFVRMVISDYLRGCEYKVIEAADAAEALTVLQHDSIRIDVSSVTLKCPVLWTALVWRNGYERAVPGLTSSLPEPCPAPPPQPKNYAKRHTFRNRMNHRPS